MHTADKSIECFVKEGNPRYKDKQAVEESSEVWMILVTVRRRIKNLLVTGLSCRPHQQYYAVATAAPVGQKPPVLPSFFLTRRRQARRSASSLPPAVQERSETLQDSFNEAAIIACMSELGLG